MTAFAVAPTLVDRVAIRPEAGAAEAAVAGLPVVRLASAALSDLELLAVGAYSPLDGFVTAEQNRAIEDSGCLPDGSPFGLPISLAATAAEAAAASARGRCALVGDGDSGSVYGRLDSVAAYRIDPARSARALYGTNDTAHPGVARLLALGAERLSGRVTLLRRPPLGQRQAVLDPIEVRREIGRRGWRSVVGFQTRNPVHRAHEYIQKVALELFDGLLLHPLVGETRADDIPEDVRMVAYRTLVDAYYPPARVLLAGYPAAMRYAGPREALLHARARMNYGCTHFIVGRDHAGAGGYYEPLAAQRYVCAFAGRMGITVLAFAPAFHCRRCASMATERTCPHAGADRAELSGTEVRRRLRAGEPLPMEFARPEVAAVLSAAPAASGSDPA